MPGPHRLGPPLEAFSCSRQARRRAGILPASGAFRPGREGPWRTKSRPRGQLAACPVCLGPIPGGRCGECRRAWG